MKNNQLIFNVKDDQIKLSFQHKVSLEEAMIVTQTGLLGMMKAVVAAIPTPEAQAQATEDIYDMYNNIASQTLTFFAPEIEMRPHLTAQAILEKENELIDRMHRLHKQTGKDVSLADLQAQTDLDIPRVETKLGGI